MFAVCRCVPPAMEQVPTIMIKIYETDGKFEFVKGMDKVAQP